MSDGSSNWLLSRPPRQTFIPFTHPPSPKASDSPPVGIPTNAIIGSAEFIPPRQNQKRSSTSRTTNRNYRHFHPGQPGQTAQQFDPQSPALSSSAFNSHVSHLHQPQLLNPAEFDDSQTAMFHASASGQPGRMPGMTNNPYSYNLRMNAPPGTHFNHPQQQPHQQLPGHSGPHGVTYPNHPHNMSNPVAGGSVMNTNSQPYGIGHVQANSSGSPGNNSAMTVPKNCSEHWASQLQLYQLVRENGTPHAHARNTLGKQLGISMGGPNSDLDKEERNRNVNPLTDSPNSKPAFSELDLGGQNLRNVSLTLFNYEFLTKLWLGHNKLIHLPASVGRLRNLTHLDLSFNQLQELPSEIGMLSKLEELLLFENNIETLPFQVGFLSRLTMIGLEGNPVNEEMKSIAVEKNSQALVHFLRETAPPPAPPQEREWTVLDDTPVDGNQKMIIMTFNSLCDRYATESQYGYTPSSVLAWPFRREIIIKEIIKRNADAICLQEIDQKNFREFFVPRLAEHGYEGIYWPKSRAKTMAEADADKVDGSATFFRSKKFILLEKDKIDFANLAINRPDMKGEHDVFNRVMPRDDIAVVALLEDRMTGTRMILVNAHIFWNELFKDVKTIQVAILMEKIHALSNEYAKRAPLDPAEKVYKPREGEVADEAEQRPARSQEYAEGSQIPLVICGDFNSKPDSGVYSLISQGSLSHQHPDLMERKYGSFTRDGMSHPFTMKSAYSNVGELDWTNYTPLFSGVIDYIWYSSNSFQVSALLGGVDKKYLSKVPGFPNHHFPSDHISLVCELVTRPRNEKLH